MHVAWFTQGKKRSGVFYANSSNQGATYSAPMRVGGEHENVSRPYLLTMGRQVWLVWKSFDGVKSTVSLKLSNDDGKTWSEPSVLAQTSGYSDHPLLIQSGNAVMLSWLTREEGYRLIKIGQQQ